MRNPKGNEKLGTLVCKYGHGAMIEVVVVVVGNHDCIDSWKLVEGDGRRMEAFRTDIKRGRVLGEDRVGKYARPVDLDVDACVADPESPQGVVRS